MFSKSLIGISATNNLTTSGLKAEVVVCTDIFPSQSLTVDDLEPSLVVKDILVVT